MWKNLKALRESQGMKQDEFGESVGLKKTTYQGYESGTREPPASFWVDVANRYAVTTDYLLGLSDDPHGTAHGGKTALEANYDALDAHGRRARIRTNRRLSATPARKCCGITKTWI